MNREYMVHYEETGTSSPRPHEKKIAKFLTEYFKSDIIFMRRGISKTPDLYILKTNVRWELKSPEGNSKHTIKHNLQTADKQSANVILDLTRTKMRDATGVSRTKEFFRTERSSIRHLKIITKEHAVIDIK